MSGPSFSSSQFSAYAAAIRQRESTDNYQSVSEKHGDIFYGAYQFGPSALTDAGFLDEQGNWTTLARSLGVTSYATFLSTPSAQDAAFQNFTEKNFEYLHNFQSYIGKTIGGVHITESGMLAGAHLVGEKDVKRFLSSNGQIVKADGNGTPITEYMTKFSHYHFTFPANSSGFSPAINTQPALIPNHRMAPKHHFITLQKPAPFEGNSVREMLRHTKAQSQLAASKKHVPPHMMLHSILLNPRSQLSSVLNAAKKPTPAHMQLHSILMQSRTQLPSFAPPPGRIAHAHSVPPVRIATHHAPTSTRALTTGAAPIARKSHGFAPADLPPGFSEYLRRLSRLPPSGPILTLGSQASGESAHQTTRLVDKIRGLFPWILSTSRGTAFDPRLTPTWAGLKLPG